MSAAPICIVCKVAPSELTAFIENPKSGAKLTFPCCFTCMTAAAEPAGKSKMATAADSYAISLQKVGGQA